MHRVPLTTTAVLPVLDPLRVQTFVLRLIVVPLFALRAAQGDPLSPHIFLSLAGLVGPACFYCRGPRRVSEDSLLRYTVSGTLRRESSLPSRWHSGGPRGAKTSPAFRLICFCRSVLLSCCSCLRGCHRFRFVNAFVLLLLASRYRLLPAPAFVASPLFCY